MLHAIADVQTGDGWFGFALALLNVAQTLALAYMASRVHRLPGTGGRSGRSGTTLEDDTSPVDPARASPRD